ncbi:MAG: FAD-dependent oxidoreductase [Planctomycetota bacterium]
MTHARHLILGGGLFGLALADHLVRRGAEQVVVLESGSSPSRRGLDETALVLRTGMASYRALEDRALLLLEEWPSYLEVDPDYRRGGSLMGPVDAQEDSFGERLTAREAAARQPLLQLEPGEAARFFPDDGYLDTTQLLSALHWQVRRRGVRIVFDCEVDAIQDRGSHYEFRAGHRRGQASFVYFTGDPQHAPLLPSCGIGPHTALVDWHRFLIETQSTGGCLIRLSLPPFPPLETASSTYDGGILELEYPEDEIPAEERQVLLVDTHRRERFLYMESGSTSRVDTDSTTVDWAVLEAFRRSPRQPIRGLREFVVRRGSAELLPALDPVAPGILSNADRRAFAAGAFGRSIVLLALAVAERIAEETAAALPPT